MSIGKKLIICIGWVAIFAIASLLMYELRRIGTTWTNEPGFLRTIVLLLLAVSTIIPLAFAALVWFNQPKRLYKKQG
jgi:hypothetical protein